MQCENDFLNKLTAEAEAGHGHFVRAALNEISFQDRIRILRQMKELSEEHHHWNLEAPYLSIQAGTTDDLACAYIRLERHVPHKNFFGLLDKSDILYDDFVELASGNETFMDSDVSL